MGWLRLSRWRESFWVVPSALILGAVVVSQLLLWVDRELLPDSAFDFPGPLLLGVEGSRGLLSAVGGGVLTVAGTSFAITISVIATASSSYGPRLVRNFMADRANQLVLGTFLATFVYSLLVLRSVRSEDVAEGVSAFVPSVSVYVAIALALVSVAALVYFIHHIADSIQISTLVDRVRRELTSAARALYGDGVPEGAVTVPSGQASAPPTGRTVTADRSGFVVGVAESSLVEAAAAREAVVHLLVEVGTHRIPGEPLAHISVDDEDLASQVRQGLLIHDMRTPQEDIRFAASQVVEIAVRALSPGVNDPYTARNAISELGESMAVVAGCGEPPRGRTDGEGHLRLLLRLPSAVEVADSVFDDLRAHAGTDLTVQRRIVELAARMASATDDSALVSRLRKHVELVVDGFDAAGGTEFDLERLRRHAQTAFEAAGAPGPG